MPGVDKIKLKALMKGFKKREIVEEEIKKSKPFVPATMKELKYPEPQKITKKPRKSKFGTLK
jgi:hypothetical protein